MLALHTSALELLLTAKPSRNLVYQKAKEIVDSIEGIPQYLNKKQKIALIAWRINKDLFYTVGKISGRRMKQ